MNTIYRRTAGLFSLALLLIGCCTQQPDKITVKNAYPWCIVAYDSPERSPEERIALIKELGFDKYAYDWRDRHIPDTKNELELAVANDIEVIAVWLWLNAKRDSLHVLSPPNEELLKIVADIGLKTTFWVSMSGNFFKDLDVEESLDYAVQMIDTIQQRVGDFGCKVALYNHSGWFSDPYNEIAIVDALPEADLKLVYNFHHGRDHMDSFEELADDIIPHLIAVNLNGMQEGGQKIMPIGAGDREKEMIDILKIKGFNGPWGIMGHVEDVDVRTILEENIAGLEKIQNE